MTKHYYIGDHRLIACSLDEDDGEAELVGAVPPMRARVVAAAFPTKHSAEKATDELSLPVDYSSGVQEGDRAGGGDRSSRGSSAEGGARHGGEQACGDSRAGPGPSGHHAPRDDVSDCGFSSRVSVQCDQVQDGHHASGDDVSECGLSGRASVQRDHLQEGHHAPGDEVSECGSSSRVSVQCDHLRRSNSAPEMSVSDREARAESAPPRVLWADLAAEDEDDEDVQPH